MALIGLQCFGRCIGNILKFLDGIQHPYGRIFGYLIPLIYYIGYCADRDACTFGYIMYCDQFFKSFLDIVLKRYNDDNMRKRETQERDWVQGKEISVFYLRIYIL